jgi:hypothetical protein
VGGWGLSRNGIPDGRNRVARTLSVHEGSQCAHRREGRVRSVPMASQLGEVVSESWRYFCMRGGWSVTAVPALCGQDTSAAEVTDLLAG